LNFFALAKGLFIGDHSKKQERCPCAVKNKKYTKVQRDLSIYRGIKNLGYSFKKTLAISGKGREEKKKYLKEISEIPQENILYPDDKCFYDKVRHEMPGNLQQTKITQKNFVFLPSFFTQLKYNFCENLSAISHLK
jgi:hypothetical protein